MSRYPRERIEARDRFTRRTRRELPLTAILVHAYAHIFDRAVGQLRVMDASELKDHPQLPVLLEQLRIQRIGD